MLVRLSPDDWAHFAGALESIVKTVAIVFGGAWVFFKFVWQGDYQRRISFTVDVQFIGRHTDFWLVEVVAVIENKGLVSHTITKFIFDLRQLKLEDTLVEGGEEINRQTRFPHKLKKGSWLPQSWGDTFVRPGVSNRYSYVTTVPKDAAYVLLHGRFDYGPQSFHTADRVLKVPTWDAQPSDVPST